MGDEIGGHNVSGHVHTTADVAEVLDTENNRRLTFKVRLYHLQACSTVKARFCAVADDTPVVLCQMQILLQGLGFKDLILCVPCAGAK